VNPFLGDIADRLTLAGRERRLTTTKLPENRAVQLAIAVARKGESVVLLDESYQALKNLFNVVRGSVEKDYFTSGEVKKICSANGNQQIEFDNGGSITFSVMSLARGIKPDCVIRVIR
jgi:hypothetical protein